MEHTPEEQVDMNNSMFKGIRVIELAQFVFVPAAGVVLADLGAEVIKVEGIEGDPYRSLRIGDSRENAPVNLAMEQNNRGKKSIALDLKTTDGRELLLKLVETADIFLTSLRPAALERLSLGPEELRARNPRLIYARGNGLGFKGEEAERPGYDASCFWARGGFADVLAAPDAPPAGPRPALGDHTGGMYIAFGLAAALFHRERTGEAPLVETSLLGSAMWCLSSDVTATRLRRDAPPQSVGKPLRNALLNTYQTRDGRWIQLLLLNPRKHWGELCALIDRFDLMEDPRFLDHDGRIGNGEALIDELQQVFGKQDLADWRLAFKDWDAPWEVVQTIAEVAHDPQAIANDYLFDLEVANGTKIAMVPGPVAFNGSAVPVDRRPSPELGSDTQVLLREIGVDDQELDGYRQRKIIAG